MTKKLMTLFIVFLTMSFNVFALKIPTGDNIRAADAKLDGESIIEVVIGGEQPAEITTPIGKVKAKVGSTIYFYKSGALKEVTLDDGHYKNDNNEPLTTEIGTFNLCGGDSNELKFYESGSVESFYIVKSTCITVSGIKYGVTDYDYYNSGKKQICFYDSGAKDKFLPKSIYTTPYKNEEGNTIYSVTFKNKSGTFDIGLGSDLHDIPNCIEFYKDGSIKSCYLESSPNDLAKVNDQEVFISSDSNISFYEDGSIASFTSDELCMTTQGGIKLVIPAKTNIELYENGIVKSCECSNDITVKQTTYTYQGHSSEKNIFVKFNKDGNIRALNNTHDSYSDMTWIDTFYSDGSKKRIVEYGPVYTDLYGHGGYHYVNEIIFYSPQGDEFKGYDSYVGQDCIYYTLNEKTISASLQNGDKFRNLGMIYFDDTGKASSYSLLKQDKDGKPIYDAFNSILFDGKPICDDLGFPLFEETKKRFIYK